MKVSGSLFYPGPDLDLILRLETNLREVLSFTATQLLVLLLSHLRHYALQALTYGK